MACLVCCVCHSSCTVIFERTFYAHSPAVQTRAAFEHQAAAEDGAGDDVMLKVYEPPVPEVLTVKYSHMSLTCDGGSGTPPALAGRWVNELEGTEGTFTASLVGPEGP